MARRQNPTSCLRINHIRVSSISGIKPSWESRLACRGGCELASGGEQRAGDEANRGHQRHHDGQDRVEPRVTDAGAAVPAVILAGAMVVQAGHLPGATPWGRWEPSAPAAGVSDLRIHWSGHCQDAEAGGGVAAGAAGALVGGQGARVQLQSLVAPPSQRRPPATSPSRVKPRGRGVQASCESQRLGACGTGVVQTSRWRWLRASAWATNASRSQDVRCSWHSESRCRLLAVPPRKEGRCAIGPAMLPSAG